MNMSNGGWAHDDERIAHAAMRVSTTHLSTWGKLKVAYWLWRAEQAEKDAWMVALDHPAQANVYRKCAEAYRMRALLVE